MKGISLIILGMMLFAIHEIINEVDANIVNVALFFIAVILCSMGGYFINTRGK